MSITRKERGRIFGLGPQLDDFEAVKITQPSILLRRKDGGDGFFVVAFDEDPDSDNVKAEYYEGEPPDLGRLSVHRVTDLKPDAELNFHHPGSISTKLTDLIREANE